MSPGIIICVTYILAVALTSLSFVVERKEGLLERTIVAGVKIFEILISQIAVQLIVLLLQTFLLMLVIFPVFKISNNGSYVYVVILTLMQGVAGMSFGILIRVKTLTIEIKTIVFLM
jgi:ABC-type transport system involved in cytochrome c biogenesis permease component